MAKTTLRNRRSKTAPKDDGEFIFLKLRRVEYELLRARIQEVTTETARVLKRIAKNRQKRERLAAETRKILARLRAA